MKPTVLVAATSRWFPTARLVIALANAGCAVQAVCPPRHPLGKTRAVRQTHTYHGLAPLRSFKDAIAASIPDFVLPADDLATRHLHNLYSQERRLQNGTAICKLIERSLGAPASFPIVYARTAFIDLAQEEGIRVPETEVITNTDDLKKWADRTGFPTVLKANGTSGGDGVRIVHTLKEAERAFRALRAAPLLARAIKRALVDQDKTMVLPSLLRRQSVVNAQTYVGGREATSAIACWNGEVLAALHFEVLHKLSSAGPATVVRLIEDVQMSTAAEKIARRLNLSGLHGLDFIREAQTGNSYLIEINPRATQVGHLSLGPGRNPAAALYAAISGEAVQAAPRVTENDVITLFPQEWIRNPASAFLRSGYHDVPWEEPELVRACVRAHRKQTAWYSRRERAAGQLHESDFGVPVGSGPGRIDIQSAAPPSRRGVSSIDSRPTNSPPPKEARGGSELFSEHILDQGPNA